MLCVHTTWHDQVSLTWNISSRRWNAFTHRSMVGNAVQVWIGKWTKRHLIFPTLLSPWKWVPCDVTQDENLPIEFRFRRSMTLAYLSRGGTIYCIDLSIHTSGSGHQIKFYLSPLTMPVFGCKIPNSKKIFRHLHEDLNLDEIKSALRLLSVNGETNLINLIRL